MHEAFLKVESSFTKRRWVARDYNERDAQALAQRHNLPDVIARSLSARGITLDAAVSFLAPRLRDLMPDPSIFKDMDNAAGRLAQAIQKGEKIAVYGDYDVDGATASALIMRFVRAAGHDIRLYVPDRLKEGYGPNVGAMRSLATEGVHLVVCVDCGTTAHEPLKAAKECGLAIIVLDHHASEPVLPPAMAVVNPNRFDEDGRYGYLAACGVTYLFIVAVNRVLRAAHWYNDSRKEPDLLGWLDLVALGTVCDVVKLTGLNRAFVAQGLRVMQQKRNIGLAALAKVAAANTACDAYAAGFMFGPRVNAGGRIGRSDLGATLLATDDPSVAAQIAEQLNGLNTERRGIEAHVLVEAEAMTLKENLPMAFVASENCIPA